MKEKIDFHEKRKELNFDSSERILFYSIKKAIRDLEIEKMDLDLMIPLELRGCNFFSKRNEQKRQWSSQ